MSESVTLGAPSAAFPSEYPAFFRHSTCEPTSSSGSSSGPSGATAGRWRRLERSEEHTSELQSQSNLVCRLLLEKKKKQNTSDRDHGQRQRAGQKRRALVEARENRDVLVCCLASHDGDDPEMDHKTNKIPSQKQH